MRLSGIAFVFLMAIGPARAVDDMPRMTVGYYLHAFETRTPAEQVAVVNYLSGIRDHLYWQCEYTVTVPDLIDAANSMIWFQKSKQSSAEFVKWANGAPFGDMVFLGLKANPPHGAMKCS